MNFYINILGFLCISLTLSAMQNEIWQEASVKSTDKRHELIITHEEAEALCTITIYNHQNNASPKPQGTYTYEVTPDLPIHKIYFDVNDSACILIPQKTGITTILISPPPYTTLTKHPAFIDIGAEERISLTTVLPINSVLSTVLKSKNTLELTEKFKPLYTFVCGTSNRYNNEYERLPHELMAIICDAYCAITEKISDQPLYNVVYYPSFSSREKDTCVFMQKIHQAKKSNSQLEDQDNTNTIAANEHSFNTMMEVCSDYPRAALQKIRTQLFQWGEQDAHAILCNYMSSIKQHHLPG